MLNNVSDGLFRMQKYIFPFVKYRLNISWEKLLTKTHT